MPSLRGKIALLFVTCAALVFGSTPALAAPVSTSEGVQEAKAPSSPSGIKSAAVVKAVKLVAKGIRKGNKHFAKVIQYLDAKATGPFLKHSSAIANVLDDIAGIPDLILGVVGQKLFVFLTSNEGPFKLSGGTANVIKDAIMAAIEAALQETNDMDTERQALEEKVDELRKTLERLEEEWQTYSDRFF